MMPPRPWTVAGNEPPRTVEPNLSSPGLEGTGELATPGKMMMPVLPPELSQREWVDSNRSPTGAAAGGVLDDAAAATGPVAGAWSPRMRPSLWALVIVATLLALGVWIRVVMLGLEMRDPARPHVQSPSAGERTANGIEARRW